MVELSLILIGLFILTSIYGKKSNKKTQEPQKVTDKSPVTKPNPAPTPHNEYKQNEKYRKVDDYQDVMTLLTTISNNMESIKQLVNTTVWNETKDEISSLINNDKTVVLVLDAFMIKTMASLLLGITTNQKLTDDDVQEMVTGNHVGFITAKSAFEQLNLQVPESSIKSVELIANRDNILDAVLVIEFNDIETATIVKVMY